jgi:hypothetical protein
LHICDVVFDDDWIVLPLSIEPIQKTVEGAGVPTGMNRQRNRWHFFW